MIVLKFIFLAFLGFGFIALTVGTLAIAYAFLAHAIGSWAEHRPFLKLATCVTLAAFLLWVSRSFGTDAIQSLLEITIGFLVVISLFLIPSVYEAWRWKRFYKA